MAIYAPNGMMKTSFAKTLKDVSLSAMPRDLVESTAQVLCDIKCDGQPIDPSKIFVANPDENIDSAESITSLMASDNLKERYENIRTALEAKKKTFLKLGG